jgi:SAM-dependent methyltransferase
MVTEYYANSSKVPLLMDISVSVRQRIFDFFMETMKPNETDQILDVGVTCDDDYMASNFFEQLYPHKRNVMCVGTENGSHLTKKYKGMRFGKIAPKEPLPFDDKEFDIVFSSATIEHVGGRDEQRRFADEICRVSKRFFVITPNRWFPIEPHTALPLLHWLPMGIFRAALKGSGLDYWAHEENLNPLSGDELRSLFPKFSKIHKVKTFGFTSNLIIYGEST